VASGRVGVNNPRVRACFMLQTIRNISVQVRGALSVGLLTSDLPFDVTSKILYESNIFFQRQKNRSALEAKTPCFAFHGCSPVEVKRPLTGKVAHTSSMSMYL